MARDRILWMSITATAVIGLLVLLSQPSSVEEVEPLYSTADDPDPLAFECLDHSGLARHDHVALKIFIDGEPETIPGLIGINLMGAGMWGVGFNLAQMQAMTLSVIFSR